MKNAIYKTVFLLWGQLENGLWELDFYSNDTEVLINRRNYKFAGRGGKYRNTIIEDVDIDKCPKIGEFTQRFNHKRK